MNKDKIQDRYLDIIDSVSLKEFEGFSLRQILFNETFYAQNMSRKSVMSRLISTLFFAQADFVVKNEGNDILFFSQVYGRADHDGYWSKMKGLFQCFDEVQISFLRKKDILRRFSLKGLGEKIAKYKKFYKALNGIENSTHRMSLAQALLETYLFGKKLEGWQLSPSLCMCFFDSGFYENYAMQYFRKQGVITVTNQHSQPIFRDWHEDKLNQSQILNFKCDYYIAKGEFTRKQFEKAGMDTSKVKVLGSLTKRIKTEGDYSEKKIFGLFFDAPSFEFARRVNMDLISIAEQICATLGYKYYIKLHPADNKEFYISAVTDNCIEMYGKEKSLQDVFSEIDFGVFHASGVYLDMLAYGTKGYKYETDVNFPIVLEELDSFGSVEELKHKYLLWKEKSNIEKINYLDKVYALYVLEDAVEEKITEFVKVSKENGKKR